MAAAEGGDAAAAERPTELPAKGLAPLELMARRNKGMHSERSTAHGRGFTARPSDVFVVTYPKCGTTWVTQICHQLRTGGHMDFGEITEVCPWDVLALDCGQDLDADHIASPRVFKSHERAGDIARGGKYIHVCRDPADAFVSFYRFLPAWAAIPPGEISEQEFAKAVFGGVSHSGGIWDYFAEWWARRGDADVLWVCYEDLKEDLHGQIQRIAEFMGVRLTGELADRVAELSSFAYMQERTQQFDDHFVFGKIRGQMGIPSDYVYGDVAVSKVRAGGGTVGQGGALAPDVAAMLADRWARSVRPAMGLGSYADLRRAVAELRPAR